MSHLKKILNCNLNSHKHKKIAYLDSHNLGVAFKSKNFKTF